MHVQACPRARMIRDVLDVIVHQAQDVERVNIHDGVQDLSCDIHVVHQRDPRIGFAEHHGEGRENISHYLNARSLLCEGGTPLLRPLSQTRKAVEPLQE